MQNVMQIATIAGHTAQHDSRTTQNDGHTVQNDGRNTLNEELPRAPGDPLPLYLKKLFCLEMIFRTFGTKK